MSYKKMPSLFGLIIIIYGLVYILIDRFDYYIQSTNRGVLSQAYTEPIMMRIVNLIFCISLIVGGYLLIKKNKDSWYLINFASIGIILKYIFTNFMLPPFSIGNFLSFTGIHAIIALSCLIILNLKKFESRLLLLTDRKATKLLKLLIVSALVIFLYGFNEIWWIKKKSNKEYYQEMIYNTHNRDFFLIDTCHFDKEFLSIFDTLSNIEDYTSIEIVKINLDSIPIYSEKVSRFEMNVISKFFRYDTSSKTVTIIRDSNFFDKSFDTLNFVFDTLPEFLVYPIDENYDSENTNANIIHHNNQLIKIVNQYDKETKKLKEKDLIFYTK